MLSSIGDDHRNRSKRRGWGDRQISSREVWRLEMELKERAVAKFEPDAFRSRAGGM